jgi:hypothetical protein
MLGLEAGIAHGLNRLILQRILLWPFSLILSGRRVAAIFPDVAQLTQSEAAFSTTVALMIAKLSDAGVPQ